MKTNKILVLSLTMLLGLVGCGKTPSSDNSNPTSSQNSEAPSENVSESTSENVSEGTSESSQEASELLTSAKELLNQMYKDDATQSGDFKYVNKLAIDADIVTVTWSIDYKSDNHAIELGTSVGAYQNFVVNYLANTDEVCEYTLVATIADADGNTIEYRLDQSIPQFIVNTYDEWIEICTANGTNGTETVTIKGYIVAFIRIDSGSSSKGSMYLQDKDGHGYYVYLPTLDSTDTESEEAFEAKYHIGDEVIASGKGCVYSGQYEFQKGGTVTLTGRTAETANVTLDYTNGTEAFSKATSNKDAETLDPYQNARITLEGCKLGRIDDKYYYFTIGENEVEYNLYKTNYFLPEAQLTELIAKWQGGATATITGVVNCYSKTVQIYPDSVDSIKITAVASNEGKADAWFDSVSFGNYVTKDVVLATAEGVTWAVKEGTAATITDGKLVITRGEEDQTVTLTATYTYSADEAYTRDYEVVIKKLDGNNPGSINNPYTVDEVVAITNALENKEISADVVTVAGIVYSSQYKESYKSYTIWLEDSKGAKAFELYSVCMDESITADYSADDALKGKFVVCTGYVEKYDTTLEMPYLKTELSPTGSAYTPTISAVMDASEGLGTASFPYSVDKAVALTTAMENNAIATAPTTVTGVVYSSSYNESKTSYTIWLANANGEKAFELYSVALDASITADYTATDALKGMIVTCTGYLQKYVSSSDVVTCEIAFLSASKSPTGEAYTPVVSSVKEVVVEEPDTPVVEDPTALKNAIVFATVASENSWANATQYLTYTSGDITLTMTTEGTEKNPAGNTGKYYESDATWRIYSSEVSTLTIAAADGYEILTVTFSYKKGSFSGYAEGTAVAVNAQSLTLSPDTNTNILSITVTYKSTAEGE